VSRVICRAYGAGVWNGVEFREVEVDGLMVGVAEVEGEALDWFRARPHAFTVIEPDVEPQPESPEGDEPEAPDEGAGAAQEPALDSQVEDEPEAPKELEVPEEATDEPKGKKRK